MLCRPIAQFEKGGKHLVTHAQYCESGGISWFSCLFSSSGTERDMGRRKKVVLLLAVLLLFCPIQPFFSERNTASEPHNSPARTEGDHLMKPCNEGLSRLFLSSTFIMHLIWMVPFFLLGCIATMDLLLRLVYMACTLCVTWFTSDYQSRSVTQP